MRNIESNLVPSCSLLKITCELTYEILAACINVTQVYQNENYNFADSKKQASGFYDFLVCVQHLIFVCVVYIA